MSKIIGVTVGTPLSPSFIKQKFKPMEDKVNELQQAVEDHLPEAVNEALAQAKASGEFDGKTPVKGEDYWTDADKQEIAGEIMQAAGDLLLPPVTGDDNNQILQIVNGVWVKVAVKDSSVATFIDDYISSALEGDY